MSQFKQPTFVSTILFVCSTNVSSKHVLKKEAIGTSIFYRLAASMKRTSIFIFLVILTTSKLLGQITIQDSETELGIPNATFTVFTQGSFKVYGSDIDGIVDISTSLVHDSIHVVHPGYSSLTIVKRKNSSLSSLISLSPIDGQLPDFILKGYSAKNSSNKGVAKIERITAREVQLYAPQTSADLLAISDNIFVQKSQLGGGSPMMRGFSANSVIITVDGIRVNNAIFRGGNLQNVIMVDPKLVEETDVLFGPGSVVYGSDALGGVFSFQTKKPVLSEKNDKVYYQGNLSLNGSSANRENSWHVDFGYGKQKWAGLSSISVSNFNDLKMGSNGPDFYLRPEFIESQGLNDTTIGNPDPRIQYFTSYSQINIAQKFRFKPDSMTLIDWQTTYTTSSPIPRYDRLIIYDSEDSLRYANWQYGPQKWLLNSVQLKRTLNSNIADELRANISMQNVEESRENRLRNDSNFIRRTEKVRMVNANIDLSKTFKKTYLFYGLEVVHNKVNSKGTSINLSSFGTDEIASRYPNQSTWMSSAAYVMATREFNKRISMQMGSRYTYVSLEAPFVSKFYSFPFESIEFDKGAVNASIGFNYRPSKSQNLSLNIASGFRAPNIDDMGKIFDSEVGKLVVPNPELLPEYAYTADLGWKAKFGKSMRIMFNAYYTLIDNLIVRQKFPFNGSDSIIYDGTLLETQSLVNQESGTIYGFEAQLRYRINPTLSSQISYNYMRGESSDQLPIRHVTPSFGKWSLTYLKQNLKIELNSIFQGELSAMDLAISEQNKPHMYLKDSDGNSFSPSWWTLNLKGTFSMSSSLVFSSGIENILDKRYRPYSSGITAPGFNFYFGLKSHF